MYEFHYKYIQLKYENCANLLFIDIVYKSLVYEIETDDIYEDFYENKNLVDFSDYPEDSIIFYPVNKKVIGNMKNEVKGKIIREFVGLKSKMFSLVTVNNEEIKKAKGVNRNVVKNIRDKECTVLLIKNLRRHKMKRIQSNYIELELKIFVKFLCRVLMIKDILLMMVLIAWLIFIKV